MKHIRTLFVVFSSLMLCVGLSGCCSNSDDNPNTSNGGGGNYGYGYGTE